MMANQTTLVLSPIIILLWCTSTWHFQAAVYNEHTAHVRHVKSLFKRYMCTVLCRSLDSHRNIQTSEWPMREEYDTSLEWWCNHSRGHTVKWPAKHCTCTNNTHDIVVLAPWSGRYTFCVAAPTIFYATDTTADITTHMFMSSIFYCSITPNKVTMFHCQPMLVSWKASATVCTLLVPCMCDLWSCLHAYIRTYMCMNWICV